VGTVVVLQELGVTVLAARLDEASFFNKNNGTITPTLIASSIMNTMPHRERVQHGVFTAAKGLGVEGATVGNPVVGIALSKSDELVLSGPLVDKTRTGVGLAVGKFDGVEDTCVP